ncbi:2OG-Fe(II) oxygenase [Halioxenophilus sp. WMMB6]|uniref:2OG-Fe(II) oxygenase n=1 Tax=Halioxenophilus sp. WMMB6 TaxID=3073815 RepID=UPI00295E8F03|nr:2OG-Fe(II) oxygenase [Halioxenophilus sp. WMMB6]
MSNLQNNLLNLDALQAAPVEQEPYPFFIVDRALQSGSEAKVIEDFPNINMGGSFNLSDVSYGPNFKLLLDSLDTPEFRKILCDKFDVDVMDLPMMITLRGFSRQKDGRIHSDSKTKVLTILIYMNEDWPAETGRLRVLRSQTDMNDYTAEVTPGPGTLFAFKVTDNGWHGYPSFEGKRQSIQINFLTNTTANAKHQFFHGLSAMWKKLKHKSADDDY